MSVAVQPSPVAGERRLLGRDLRCNLWRRRSRRWGRRRRGLAQCRRTAAVARLGGTQCVRVSFRVRGVACSAARLQLSFELRNASLHLRELFDDRIIRERRRNAGCASRRSCGRRLRLQRGWLRRESPFH